MKLLPEDDLRHAPGPAQWWNESFYFNFFDSEAGLGGFIRIGFSPAFGVTDGVCLLHRGDGKLLLVRTLAPWTPVDSGDPVVAAGALTARCEKPLTHWQIAYEGDAFVISDEREMMFFTASGLWMLPTQRVRLALSFEAFHPPYLFPRLPQRLLPLREALTSTGPEGSLLDRIRMLPESLRSTTAMRSNHHFEQAGRWRGAVEIDAERFDFAGTGMRDRSWGIRDWKVFSRYRWINAQFGEQLAFSAFRVRVVGHEAWGGYVWQDGRLSTLSDWSREEQAGGAAVLTLRPESGREIAVQVKTITPVPFILQDTRYRTVIDLALGRFACDGQETLGMNEHLQRSYP
jgi:hypothetical protein